MTTSTLRAVGGSVMMAIPKPFLESLGLGANAKVALSIEDGRLIAVPKARPKYTLEELLAECDSTAVQDQETADWLADGQRGDEAL